MSIHYADETITLHCGDALAVLREMPDESVNCVVTSPPYFALRDYGVPGQYGVEPTPSAYVATMAAVFAEVRRVLTADGTLWLNLGDTYAGKGNAGASVGMTRRADRAELIPPRVNTTAEAPYKSLLMLPERVALAMIEGGWTLRNRIVWHKVNSMPESVTDRLATRHEALFLFARSDRYWFDLDTIREPHSMEQRRRTVKHNYNPPSDQPEHRGLHKVRDGKSYDGNPAGRNPGDVWSAAPELGTAGIPATCGPQPRSWERRKAEGAPLRRGVDPSTAAGDSDFAAHENGPNPGDVWAIPTQPFPGAHFAVFPPSLAERCILAGCRPGGVVLDPFAGSCTTGLVATKHGRRFVGIDLNPEYLDLALRTRLAQSDLPMEVA